MFCTWESLIFHGPAVGSEQFTRGRLTRRSLNPVRVMKTIRHTLPRVLLVLSAFHFQLTTAHAQGTAFTYQGRLNAGASPANGSYDLSFTLFATNTSGVSIGGPLTNSVTAVSNGLFTVTLDFGNQFPGAERWLEIGVRTNGGSAFTTLSPRQPLTSTPYAVQSANAATAASASSVAAKNITGTLTAAQLPSNVVINGASEVSISGTFSGNGAGVTNLNLSVNSFGAISMVGNFVLASSPGVGAGPYSVVAADVNGDGRVDLISANSGTNTLTVLANNGSGGFGYNATPGVGGSPHSVVAADVNGDGKVDLICAGQNWVGYSLFILTNNGSGGFDYHSSPNVGNQPFSVVAGDVNGDGTVDLISANSGSGTLTVLTNNESGDSDAFDSYATLTVGIQPVSVVAADVNGDDRVDLISADKGSGTLTVLTNNGSSGFGFNATLPGGFEPISVVAADVNGDGKVDLISASREPGGLPYGRLTVLTNNGSGGFDFNAILVVGRNPTSVVAADVNGDGEVDLVSANFVSSTLTVLTNNGSGGFGFNATLVVGPNPTSVVAADVNGDGKVDLVSANSGSDTLTVLFNTGFSFTGIGSGLADLNASQISSGTVADARLSANVSLLGQSIESFEIADGTIVDADISAAAGIADMKLATIATSGKVADSALSANVAVLNRNPQDFTGTNTFANKVGIGTTAPAKLLQVGSTASTQDGMIKLGAGNGLGVAREYYIGVPYGGSDANGTNYDFIIQDVAGGVRLDIDWNSGNVGISTPNPTNKLHVLGGATFESGANGANQAVVWTPGSGGWSFTSDRATKERVAPVNPESVLDKLTRIPVNEWSYIGYEQRHIGPMAQDFHAEFPLNENETALNDADLHGVALAAIQGLNRKLEEKEVKIAELEKRLARLERLVNENQGAR